MRKVEDLDIKIEVVEDGEMTPEEVDALASLIFSMWLRYLEERGHCTHPARNAPGNDALEGK